MDKFHRYNDLLRLLKSHRLPVKLADLAEKMECDKATVKRIVSEMRDFLDAPIVSNRNGYQLDAQRSDSFELPGVWFSSGELVALLTMQQVLAGVREGILAEEFKELRHRIDKLLANRKIGSAHLAKKVRALMHGVRGKNVSAFTVVADALAREKQLTFDYHRRDNNQHENRHVSPQQLLYYRGNLYLQAWCHQRKALRRFALERITQPLVIDESIYSVDSEQLEQAIGAGYGIFSGPAPHTAVLRFKTPTAHWIEDELWHPEQQQKWLSDGRLELRLPFGNPIELTMDILRHGSDVEVMSPKSLRDAVKNKLRESLDQYD